VKISGWGNFPCLDSEVLPFQDEAHLRALMQDEKNLLAFGNGRSYGDSALAKRIVKLTPHHLFQAFEESSGLLEVDAGVLLSEIVDAFAPRGWFLQVTPGTKLITVGGAIASDVHGKNHHQQGCFSESLQSFEIMLASGEVVECSQDNNLPLFRATCGGMGLTGIILSAKIFLKRIHSNRIHQTTIKTRNLKETFEAFEQYQQFPYSVAWIDCLAKGQQLGRCLLNVGHFAEDEIYDYSEKRKLEVPFRFPDFALNRFSVSLFNQLYYAKIRQDVSQQTVSIDSFFYPLDAIAHWNRIYGKNGFVQYQFILPLANSFQGLEEILASIAEARLGSFLAVLKLYGEANENLLSFPMEGYSLALDFKLQPGVFELLDRLDQIVLKYRGRIYLAKDARMSRAVFDAGYAMADQFRRLRVEMNMQQKFRSLQSDRLGL